MTAKTTDILDFDAGPLANSIAEWTGRLLGPYLERFPQNHYKEPKLIHDPIGKAIMLQPWEVYVLDSPLLQRLRTIRQLGVGHLLFPTSGYSRFEHSVGSVQAATTLFDSVSDRANNPAVSYDGDQLFARRDVVRLAALLHDIGHSVFSHVSEKFYSQDKDLQKALKLLKPFYKNNDIAAAECVAILIIRSPAFQKLIAASSIRRSVFNDREIVDMICSCIAGSKRRVLPDAYLAEIVNGPVDCDKVDYLARDGHMAGVPISLDIERLCSKLRLIKVLDEDKKPVYALAIVPSGARALEEMLVSRIFLYDKFYYHPKVMAAEELIRRALFYLSKAYPVLQSPSTLLEFGDDEFLSLSPKAIVARLGPTASESDLTRGCELLGKARARDLPKRAFAFASRFLPEIPEVFARFVSRGKSETSRWSTKEWLNVDKLLQVPGGPDLVGGAIANLLVELKMKADVFVGYQSAGRAAGKMDMPVVLPGGKVDATPNFLFNVSKWTDAYALNKQTSYVFGFEHLTQIHLATERYFAERELVFAPSSWVFTKLHEADVDAARSALPESEAWIGQRLPPDYLQSEKARERLEKLRNKFAAYLNSFSPEYGTGLLESWVWQFPDADLQDSALALLEQMTVVEKRDIVDGFGKLLEKKVALKSAVWIPLRPIKGRAGTSADLMRYDLKDLGVEVRDVGSLDPQEVRKAGRIVFFDDLLNTGAQAEALLKSWFTSEPFLCESPNDKDFAGQLDEDCVAALRRAKIDFVYYSTTKPGIATLEHTCRELTIPLGEVTGWIDASSPQYTLESFKASSNASTTRFVEYLAKRGQSLLSEKYSGKEGWTEDRIREFSLGFGGLRLTLLYTHSVSTGMPVALWQMSLATLSPWLPVFPRKEKQLRQVLGVTEVEKEPTEDLPDYSIHDQDETDQPAVITVVSSGGAELEHDQPAQPSGS